MPSGTLFFVRRSCHVDYCIFNIFILYFLYLSSSHVPFHQQAHFRGQRVRRRLNEALRAAQFYDEEGEEEFDYDEEVDLTAFDFDESVLEQGWTPSETPQLPSRYEACFVEVKRAARLFVAAKWFSSLLFGQMKTSDQCMFLGN